MLDSLHFCFLVLLRLQQGIVLGLRPKVHGKIDFDDVYFNYPARTDVKILRGLSLRYVHRSLFNILYI
jgi:hypothetical protein